MITPKEFNERKKLLQKTKEEKLQDLIAAPLCKAFLELEKALEKGKTRCYVTVRYTDGVKPDELEVALCDKMNELLEPYEWQVGRCSLVTRPTMYLWEYLFEIEVEEFAPF